jgi:predicted nucleotide-binding protein (sugar kinase/HSP70/actin superfamily)
MLVIKLDEHTGEAGVDTRLEAFIDMLERRMQKNIATFSSHSTVI